MKILTYTTLYPNCVQSRHGIFIETRLKHLIACENIQLTVVAPVPWFPFSGDKFGVYGKYKKIPAQEKRINSDIYHPRYPVIPKIGMNIAAELLFMFTVNYVKKLIEKIGGIDLIDAHYFYPDGVAAVKIGQALGIPVVISARGSDINLIPNYLIPRKKIVWAANHANSLIAVSKSLKNRMIEIGINENKITVIGNGVDTKIFYPRNSTPKKKLKLLTVGNLVESKGHHLVIDALLKLPDFELTIIGEGHKDAFLRERVLDKKLEKRVSFVGNLSQNELADYYSSATILVLASRMEGWPNVLLESMACGTPVVVTNVGAVPNIVNSPSAGVVISSCTADSLVIGVNQLLTSYPSQTETIAHANQFSWEMTTNSLETLFMKVADI